MSDALFVSGADVPEWFLGVELMTVGMQWPASTGDVTITTKHLDDAVIAANDDPHIQVPRIKLGHTSPVNGDHPNHDPFAAIGDAEPSFGQFVNLRLTNDGAVLVGDATNVISWLAASAPSTYASRSAEATWAVEPSFDVQTAGGKRYEMCLTAVSLLGVALPAISDLEDLSTLIMDGPSALAASQTPAALAAGDRAALSISEDEIRQRFNFDWAMDEENGAAEDTYWWWCREVRVSEGEIIADDDEGHLWMVPFTDADGVTTFGEPGEVRKTYIPVAASVAQVACFARPSKPQRPPAAAGTTPAATVRPDQGVNMDDDVREFLVARGIDPDTASEVQVNAAKTLMPEPGAAVEPPPAADEPVAEVEQEAPEAERVPVAAARQIPDGMRLIDAATLAELQAGAQAGTQLAREKATETRDRVLAAARDEGRITPARIAHFATLYDADPEGTTVLLTADEDKGGIAKGLVPLAARAQTPDPDGDGITYDANGLLPENVSLLNSAQRSYLLARRGA